MKKNLSNDEITDQLIILLDVDNDNQLAKHFGVTRQQIRQFRNGERIGFPQAVITELLTKLVNEKNPD